jgi:hypothetical protein
MVWDVAWVVKKIWIWEAMESDWTQLAVDALCTRITPTHVFLGKNQ